MSDVLLSVQARLTLEDLDDDTQDAVFDELEHDIDSLWARSERIHAEGRTYGRVLFRGLEIVLRPLDVARDGRDGYLIATLRRVR